MQARQEQFDKFADRLQATAVIQERILGRIDSLERWRDEQDERVKRQEERRDMRIEKAPDNRRANIALAVSLVMVAIYLLGDLIGVTITIVQHWK